MSERLDELTARIAELEQQGAQPAAGADEERRIAAS